MWSWPSESRKSTHKSASWCHKWESHWSYLLLVHHAIIHLSMSSLFMYEINVPRCKLIGCFLHVALEIHYEDSKVIVVIMTNPMHQNRTKQNSYHLSRSAYASTVAKSIHEWECETYVNKGCFTLIIAMKLLCELELGLHSMGVSKIRLCCPPPWAMVNMKLTIRI